jgi:hypothetical protein
MITHEERTKLARKMHKIAAKHGAEVRVEETTGLLTVRFYNWPNTMSDNVVPLRKK